jgi:hypothetical protein
VEPTRVSSPQVDLNPLWPGRYPYSLSSAFHGVPPTHMEGKGPTMNRTHHQGGGATRAERGDHNLPSTQSPNHQLVGQPQVRQGVRPRAGAPAGFPNLLTSPPWSNPTNRPGSQTMPECRFNKYNATSIPKKNRPKIIQRSQEEEEERV